MKWYNELCPAIIIALLSVAVIVWMGKAKAFSSPPIEEWLEIRLDEANGRISVYRVEIICPSDEKDLINGEAVGWVQCSDMTWLRPGPGETYWEPLPRATKFCGVQ